MVLTRIPVLSALNPPMSRTSNRHAVIIQATPGCHPEGFETFGPDCRKYPVQPSIDRFWNTRLNSISPRGDPVCPRSSMAPDDDRRVDPTFSASNMAANTIQHHQVFKPRIAQYGRFLMLMAMVWSQVMSGDGKGVFAPFLSNSQRARSPTGDVCPCCRDVQHFWR